MKPLQTATLAAIWTSVCLFGLRSPVAGAEQSQANPVPPGWLTGATRKLIVEVRHENLQPGCRQSAGELTQSIIDELLNSGATLSFSRSYVQAELKYLRANLETNATAGTIDGLTKSLEAALRSGQFDWQHLRELHVSAPDSDTVASHLPWLSSRPDMRGIRLADAEQTSTPTLELAFTWSSVPMRGVVSTSTGGLNNRIYTGKGVAWKFDAELRLRQGGTNQFARSYPAPRWEERYHTVESRPLFVMTRTLLQDIKTGLVPSPVAASPKKQRRK